MTKLTREQCLAAEAMGEFGADVVGAAGLVAVVLSQSWCPQWLWMRSYLSAMPASGDLAVFWIEYDREDFFESFMSFKERVLGNDQVPYVRYYRGGALFRETNYIDKGGFLRILAAP